LFADEWLLIIVDIASPVFLRGPKKTNQKTQFSSQSDRVHAATHPLDFFTTCSLFFVVIVVMMSA
jgi:hypothetical protein